MEILKSSARLLIALSEINRPINLYQLQKRRLFNGYHYARTKIIRLGELGLIKFNNNSNNHEVLLEITEKGAAIAAHLKQIYF